MTRVEHRVTIDRPADEVFRFLADGANNPRWQPPVVKTSRADVQLVAGTRFNQTMRHPFGFRISSDYRITVFEPNRALALKTISGGPIRPVQHYELTAESDDRTTVRSIIEYQPHGLVRLALPTLAFLRPLFAWETSWLDNVRELLQDAAIQTDRDRPEQHTV
jgi:uncharacterized membrane protein